MLTRIVQVAVVCAVAFLASSGQRASANYYSSYVYYEHGNYYCSYYYYKPVPTFVGYRSHHCYYYPYYSTRYIYFYNPYRQLFWGRYDLKNKGYSMLAEKDRRKDLKDVSDAAFSEPAEMPAIPETSGGDKMSPPPAPPEPPSKK